MLCQKRHYLKKYRICKSILGVKSEERLYMPMMDKMEYRHAISKVQKGDIALSIGGDNYCYWCDNKRYTMLTIYFRERR